METAENSDFRSGFIAIIGAPNAGKSTLLNQIIGQKISITSKKPQTTRDRILGVVERPQAQMVFMDTPGIHKASSLLNRKIVDQALAAVQDVDAILLLVDVTSGKKESHTLIIEQLAKTGKPILLALNKIDRIEKNRVLPLIEKYSPLLDFKAIIPISAKNGTHMDALLSELEGHLPRGARLFPEDTLTDMTEKFIAGEMIREKIFRLTGMEIPYSIAVSVDSFKVEKSLIEIHASIHVDRNSQKGIIIGKGGAMLKKIGTQARKDIERMTGLKVLLKLFVKVNKNWSQNEKALKEFGY
ncbi:GTPase Era [Desulfocicer niacini]